MASSLLVRFPLGGEAGLQSCVVDASRLPRWQGVQECVEGSLRDRDFSARLMVNTFRPTLARDGVVAPFDLCMTSRIAPAGLAYSQADSKKG